MPAELSTKRPKSNFRRFFFRGLGILLPTVLTIWILVAVYQFVDDKIARPINAGVKELVIRFTPWPAVSPEETRAVEPLLSPEERATWKMHGNSPWWLEQQARRLELRQIWNQVSIGNWAVLDLIGVLIAAVLIYTVGLTLGSFFGRQLWKRGEELLTRLPVFRAIYPSVKQVTDFLFGDEKNKMKFDKVVAVEYPRKGLFSVGLVTGATLRSVQERRGVPCYTVFVPSSPTPFTGWVIIVPVEDTIELPISIDDALRFAVSGGVIVPPSQVMTSTESTALAG